MTYTVIWRNEARQAMSRLRAADSADARLLIAAVGALTANPHPTTSNQLGGSRFWRLRLAELRVVYEVEMPSAQSTSTAAAAFRRCVVTN
jgi:mRNA-degrading endonuclease RelE of RelBE toxin-antitoxin system